MIPEWKFTELVKRYQLNNMKRTMKHSDYIVHLENVR